MKTKVRDEGLMYLKRIGFQKINSSLGLAHRWERLYGKEKSNQLFETWESIKGRSTAFYEFKNSDYELSKSISETYDGDIIRNECNFLSAKKRFVGKTILEVGCESGYLTGFLASFFPESQIVAIDRSSAAIAIAQKRISKLGCGNVEFRNCALADITDTYDTVVSMRTIQENIDYSNAPFKGEPIYFQFLQYQELSREHVSNLASRVSAGGSLLVFERVGKDPLLGGILFELCDEKCSPQVKTIETIRCHECDGYNTFHSFVCSKGLLESKQSIVDYWCSSMSSVSGKAVLDYWDALTYLSINAGKLIQGVRLYDGNRQVGRLAVFRDNSGPLVYYLAATEDSVQLFSYNSMIEKDVINLLQTTVEQKMKQNGYSCTEFNQDDKYIEGSKALL